MSSSFSPGLSKAIPLPPYGSWPAADHQFDEPSVNAVQTALAIGRPLLLRGEPGIGKSQLARAVANALGVPFRYHVVDERTERDDLLYTFDAVARLAEAQVCALTAREAPEKWRAEMSEHHFIRPGVMWWAYHWDYALERAEKFHKRLHRPWTKPEVPEGWTPNAEKPCGPVVLIDEIDKADPSVPNGLLECLGNDGFQIPQIGECVRLSQGAKAPLIMITTNEERELPSAFLRRCLVFRMPFPERTPEEGIAFLLARGNAFAAKHALSDEICLAVAQCIMADRSQTRSRGAKPGASEYLDLLRALAQHSKNVDEQKTRLQQVASLVLAKHDFMTE